MLTPASPQHTVQSTSLDHGGDSWLDRPILATLTLDREKALYGLFILLAVLSRFWNLGQHLMSHDETVHANWSWHLYQGHGYQHHPLSHGPFLFHATALSYYIFGDNDFTARLVVAVLGVVLVALPYTLRGWLGRSGALVASFLFLISPSILYYSRYVRNDVPIVVWALIAVLAVFRYLEAGRSESRFRWLVILAAALSLMLGTKEVSFFYIAIFGLFLVFLFFARLGIPRRGALAWEQWGRIWLTVLGFLAVILLAAGLLLFVLNLLQLFPVRYRDCGQAPVPGPAPSEMQCTEAGCALLQGRCQRPMPVIAGDNVLKFDQTGTQVAIRLTSFEMWVAVVLISIIAVVAGGGAFVVLRRLMPFQPPWTSSTSASLRASPEHERSGPSIAESHKLRVAAVDTECWRSDERPALDLILVIGSFALPFLAHLAISGLSRAASRAFFGIDAAFNSLDYSEAGLLRSAGFVSILLAISTAVGLWWDWRRWLVAAGVFYGIVIILFTTVFTNGNGLASGMVGSLGYWMEQQAVERGSQPLYYYGLMVALYEFLPLIGFAVAAVFVLTGGLAPNRNLSRNSAKSAQAASPSIVCRLPFTFILFLFFWTALTWLIYSVAGEKMPWMTVHHVAPMILVSGWIIGRLIEGTDWRVIVHRHGWIAILITPLGLAALVQTISPWLTAPESPTPFSGYGVGQLNATTQFLSAFSVLSVSVGILYWVWRRTGTRCLVRTLAALGLAVLAVLTVRTAWSFAFVNFDYASEFLVYAHASPDVRVVMEQIEDISRRTSGELSLDIGYTADGSYPFIWYLRSYPNASQLPNPPSGPDLDKSVIIAGNAEWGGIQPYLGDSYMCHPYNFMWWPMQDYYDLTWDRIRYALTNREMRGAVWDIVFRRDYRKYERVTGKTIRLSEWPLRDGFRFCVRRNLLARVWGESAGPVEITAERERSDARLTDYAVLEQPTIPELEIKELGRFGSFNGPHGLAQDAEGFLYVADTDNHRIVKLSPEGQAVDTWDSTWWQGLQTWRPNGCLDEAGHPLAQGDGQFCEPWGVAVGPDGHVYVADTWNHRVQVFTPDGRFQAKVGAFGQSGNSAASAPALFFGPRDLVVDKDGRIFVADTGNKRVQVFDGNLEYLRSFGGPGIVEGRLDEPVGLAIGPDHLLYVADTWNRRLQVLTLAGEFVLQWPVAGWGSQSVFNKPYVAFDNQGRVYVSDPEGWRLFVFDVEGAPLAVLDLGAVGGNLPSLPTGIHIDSRDRMWVSDAANHCLLRFPPLSLVQPDGRAYP